MSAKTPKLKISGKDAQIFLQGQLSNDINKITDSTWQLNAYCQHQGRVIALIWIQKRGSDFYLDFAPDLQQVVHNRLKMFALNAKVVFSEIGNQSSLIDNAQVTFATSEKFIPQDLNLDINEVGVSFTKGCYPGQEVVARVHYLGKPKRRLYRFECDFAVSPLDELTLKDTTKVVGKVLNQVESQTFGVIKTAEKNQALFIKGRAVKLLGLVDFADC